jgi:hypothetical protein
MAPWTRPTCIRIDDSQASLVAFLKTLPHCSQVIRIVVLFFGFTRLTVARMTRVWTCFGAL